MEDHMRYTALGLGLALTLPAAGAGAQQCYRRVVEPPQFSTVVERVLVAPARETQEYVPAVTREVARTVVVRPERSVAHVIPAEYVDRVETVETSPAHREWRTRDEGGDVIGCWVNVPARYAEVRRRVLASPAREVTETLPEETATRYETEVVEPAHYVTQVIPARYALRERQVLISQGGARWARIDECVR
jgi:hypothetical protein